MIFSKAASLKKGKELLGVIHSPLLGACCMSLLCEGGFGAHKVIIEMTPLIQSHVFNLKGSRRFQSNETHRWLLQHRVVNWETQTTAFSLLTSATSFSSAWSYTSSSRSLLVQGKSVFGSAANLGAIVRAHNHFWFEEPVNLNQLLWLQSGQPPWPDELK